MKKLFFYSTLCNKMGILSDEDYKNILQMNQLKIKELGDIISHKRN